MKQPQKEPMPWWMAIFTIFLMIYALICFMIGFYTTIKFSIQFLINLVKLQFN